MRRAITVVVLLGLAAVVGRAQSAPLRFKQVSDGAPPVAITSQELSALSDPLFNLVLKTKADLISLAKIEETLQPDAAKRKLFVVAEQIVSSAQNSFRRSVVTFSGVSGGETLDGNVMLSVSFDFHGIDASPDIEAWGWDNARQRYNYYKLDRIGSTSSTPFWKFRVSSAGAEQRSVAERQGTCLACHVSGAPIMKELFFPWNNWHAGVGGSFKADYLDPSSLAADTWPAARTAEFTRLATADQLEDDFLKPALKRFALARLNAALNAGPLSTTGTRTVLKARQLLRPLFETTDVNLYSSRNTSGVHPFGQPTDFLATQAINLPVDQFFLNTDLMSGDGEGALGGLRLDSARGFKNVAPLTQQENKELINTFKVKLNGVSGDTEFAWLVPGVSYADNALIDQCLQQGVVSPHFLAAVLAIDLETPVFSTTRAALQVFLPDQFDFTPVATGVSPTSVPHDVSKDRLTAAVIAKIDAGSPVVGSPPDQFRTLLKSPDAVAVLDQRIVAYRDRVKANLDKAPANAAARKAELERLFKIVLDRRRAMVTHPILKNLDETGGRLLLPLP
jgi:hypothetical protein